MINNTTISTESCQARLISLTAIFVLYAFVLVVKLRQLFLQKKQLESSLKSEKIYNQWLVRHHHHQDPAPTMAEIRPRGPHEEDEDCNA